MKKITSLFLSFVFAFFTFSVIVATNDSCDVSAAKIYETPYYYNQLSDSAQNAYDDLKEVDTTRPSLTKDITEQV